MSTQACPHTPFWPPGVIFTVGHSTLPIERFITLLKLYAIKCVADIRTIPRSRRNPEFNEATLATSLVAQHVEYVPLQSLGGLRSARKDSPNTAWRNRSFRGYADYMQTPEFAVGVASLVQIGHQKRVAIMCAEALPWRCHRSLVADALEVRGVGVVDILSENNYRAHKLTPFAHIRGTQITYPPVQADLL